MSSPFFAGLMTIVTLAGVPVEVTGASTTVLPAPPDPAHMEVIWPTNRMAMYTSVLMNNGERWQVPSVPRRTPQGGVTVVLRSPQGAQISVTVPRVGLTVPMWWVGELPPGPPQEVPGTGEQIDTPPDPAPVPNP